MQVLGYGTKFQPYAGRRRTREVMVGNVGVGGDNPIRVQSMTTTLTKDVDATVEQSIRLVEAGCEIVRITTPTVQDAKALGETRAKLRARGIDVPLVADIHFSPAAAMEAAEHAEKVRVNPGNFADSRQFKVREYTDEEYAAELLRLEERFTPLVLKCKERGVAMRIGTNHGSLSDRIMNRFGDTPQGMCESALEFVRICRQHDYHQLIMSMKASNPKVMIAAYRLLAQRMDEEGMDYPFHLGVTEAGNGEDARIKSAIGIGGLLEDGIGDTIRVSLAEEPENEVPVAFEIARKASPGGLPPVPTFTLAHRGGRGQGEGPLGEVRSTYTRRPSDQIGGIGGHSTIAVIGPGPRADFPDVPDGALIANGTTAAEVIKAGRELAAQPGDAPIHLRMDSADLIEASIGLGSLLCDGIGDSVEIAAGVPEQAEELAFNILQASGARLSRTDYVACPGCGRTLFDLESTTNRIKARTAHLPGVRIAVMGCIVNGPGEMADADFGYVGSAPGRVNLYVGKEQVARGVPTGEADERLIELIKARGKWVDPPS
ncbi:MAG TPA: (E)-4-hydroxy-3-methylbut-2-enyl-diphosphate synthase [Chloroflexota bacterium]|nr:(E)-4-hydroxy-3-methylbut-2-enyl-diphosphate synthase [Chloroflexota bacterium]